VRIAKAFVGARGWDSVNATDDVMAAKMRATGMEFTVRYLGLLTPRERDVVLVHDLALMPVTLCRAPGWLPSEALGLQDGAEAVRHLDGLLPKGCTVGRDLEGPGGNAQSVVDYVNAWCRPVREAGYDPGLYVGYGCHLTGAQLEDLAVDRYWHSLSRVADDLGATAEPRAGWCMHQLYATTTWHGYTVDVNFIQRDYRNRLPNWVVA
jgi:hypothetical protein